MSNIYDLYKQNLTEDSNDGFDTGVRAPWKTLKVRQDFSELEDGTVLKPGTFFEYVSKNAPVSEDGSVGVTFPESDHIDCLVFATRTSRVLGQEQ